MLCKRIIPCLDILNGRTVKGTRFVNLRDAGDPVELASLYSRNGADELVFLDITATHEGRKLMVALVGKIAAVLDIPFTVGGGISEMSDAEMLLDAGADKISLNSSAILNPGLVDSIAGRFGNQFVVAAVDAKFQNGQWTVFRSGGRIETDKELFAWAAELQNRGAGEILFTSMDHDGTKNGFAVEAIRELSESLAIPVIASGGAGDYHHFRDVFTKGKADAALAAGIFHFGEMSIPDLKKYLNENNVTVRKYEYT